MISRSLFRVTVNEYHCRLYNYILWSLVNNIIMCRFCLHPHFLPALSNAKKVPCNNFVITLTLLCSSIIACSFIIASSFPAVLLACIYFIITLQELYCSLQIHHNLQLHSNLQFRCYLQFLQLFIVAIATASDNGKKIPEIIFLAWYKRRPHPAMWRLSQKENKVPQTLEERIHQCWARYDNLIEPIIAWVLT